MRPDEVLASSGVELKADFVIVLFVAVFRRNPRFMRVELKEPVAHVLTVRHFVAVPTSNVGFD